MTCIAAVIDNNGTIWMGGDAGVKCGESSLESNLPKVFIKGEFIIGVTGTSRVSQLIRYVLDPPDVKGDVHRYMVTDFVRVLRDCMKEHGGECKNQEDDGPETIMDGRVLVGCRGQLFQIDHGYGVTVTAVSYQAVGSAVVEARAAMFTVSRILSGPIPGERLVQSALDAAMEFDGNIRPPFTILKLPSSLNML